MSLCGEAGFCVPGGVTGVWHERCSLVFVEGRSRGAERLWMHWVWCARRRVGVKPAKTYSELFVCVCPGVEYRCCVPMLQQCVGSIFPARRGQIVVQRLQAHRYSTRCGFHTSSQCADRAGQPSEWAGWSIAYDFRLRATCLALAGLRCCAWG